MLCGFEGAAPKAGERERGRTGAGRARPSQNSGGNGEGDPPVPIPNTAVKPFSADGTWLETARESRSPPVPTKCTALAWNAGAARFVMPQFRFAYRSVRLPVRAT